MSIVNSATTENLDSSDVEAIDELREVYASLKQELSRVIVGQERVIEELAILMHNPDPLPGLCDLVPAEPRARGPKKRNRPLIGRKIKIAELDQRGLSRPGRPGQEIEIPGLDMELCCAEQKTVSIAEGHIVQIDHEWGPSASALL